jgi:hypothetical protein
MSRIQIVFVFVFFLFSFVGSAQEKDTIPIHLSGMVVTSDSIKPIPFASVSIQGTDRGTIADEKGFFSMITYRNETIIFSSIGFKPAYYHIPDTMNKDRYMLIQSLHTDTIYIDETYIFPWRTYEQFKTEFVKAEIPDEKEYSRALKNIEQIKKSLFTVCLSLDATGNYKGMTNAWENKARNIGFITLPTIGTSIPLTRH